jgi:hypothetical protein
MDHLRQHKAVINFQEHRLASSEVIYVETATHTHMGKAASRLNFLKYRSLKKVMP